MPEPTLEELNRLYEEAERAERTKSMNLTELYDRYMQDPLRDNLDLLVADLTATVSVLQAAVQVPDMVVPAYVPLAAFQALETRVAALETALAQFDALIRAAAAAPEVVGGPQA